MSSKLKENIKTYIIHFDELKERKKKIKEQLSKTKILEPEWIIQKGYYPDSLLNQYYNFDKKEWIIKVRIAKRVIMPYKLTKSQKHIIVNHMKARERISKGKHNYALILEDDALFCKDFDHKLKKILEELSSKEWDIVYLAYHPNEDEIPPKTNQTILTKEKGKYSCYGAGAYLLKKDAARKIVELDSKVTLPNDEELKYRINKLNLNVYWVYPPLIKQSSKEGDGESSRDDLTDIKVLDFHKKLKRANEKLPPPIRISNRKIIHKLKKLYLGIK